MKIRAIAASVMLSIAPSLLGAAAPVELGAADSGYMKELEAIAGEPQDYTPVTDKSAGNFQTMALDPYKCTLWPSEVHLRKSGGWQTAGAKPYTKCTAGAPSHISQSSTLYMVEWAGLSYVHLTTKTVSNGGVRSLTQRNVEWRCKNSNNSRFNQQTKGYSVQGGRNYQSAVQTPIVSQKCGK